MQITDLPDDIKKLKEIILQKESQLSELRDTILLLQRKKFAPTSEQLKNEAQLLLFNEAENIVEGDVQEKTETITYERKKRGKRKPIPDNIPRVDDIYDLSDKEKIGMKYIGDEISEKLEIKPAKIFVRRIIKKKYAPIKSEGSIVTAVSPKELLPKSLASSSLVAYIITSKYVDALPLYRQEKIFERISGELKRQTMARWLIKVSEKLIPLYNLMQDICLERNYLEMDETRIQVLDEKGKKATSKSYMWVRYSPGEEPIVLYDYSPTRAGSVPIELLSGFKGVLQVDGYDGYQAACERYGLSRAGCWDHARRKFFDAQKTSNGRGIGKKALDQIKKFYKIEKSIQTLPLEEKLKVRQEKLKPLLLKFKGWIDEIRGKIAPTSTAGKAINYAFNEWDYLTVFLEYPNVHMSNILVENAIRPFVVGRKNWLFSQSVDGAKASAMYYSIIETAKANGFEPFDYLNRMLDKLPSAETLEDYQRLLPFKDQFMA